MKNKHMTFIGLTIIFLFVLTAFTGSGETRNVVKEKTEKSTVESLLDKNNEILEENKALELQLNNTNGNSTPPSGPQNSIAASLDIMQLIKDKDMTALSNHVHPTKGLTFSPNVHIVTGIDLVFTAQEVAGLPQDTTVYNWGYYVNVPTTTEINLNFNDYYDEFIYDNDYINPNIIGNNHVVNTGDEIDNIDNEYPNADYREFMIVGVPHNTGSDWRSLKLVFEESNGQSYLTAIVHGQWVDLGSQ